MSLSRRLINTGGAAAAACPTETTDIFGDSSGVALYSLDYDASDASGTYDGTPTNIDFGVDGQINYGARFNGSSSKIALPSLGSGFTGSSSRSVSAWVKITSTPSGSIAIFNSGSAATNQSFGYFIGTSRQVIISYYNRNWQTSETISLDTWNHILFTYNGGAVETSSNSKIYINGTPATLGSTTGSATGSINTPDTNHTIGVFSPTNSLYFNGSIDQVRLFSKALSSDEVSTLYAETACVYTSTTDIVNYPTGTTPIAYYKLDNSSEDYSTGGNDGTDTNIEYRFGRFGQAAVFNGSTSFIDTNIDSSIGNSYSISLWFNSNSNASTWKQLTGLDNDTYNYTAYISRQANGTLNFIGSDDGSNVTATGTTVTSINQWYHVVAVKDGTTTKLYLDGQEEATGSANATTSWLGSLILGKYFGTTNQSFDGTIDQMRIYDAALTSSQVTELYNEKPEVDTSNFKTVLYTGDGGTQYISNVGFQPDLVWIKSRNASASHVLSDSVRGANLKLRSNSTAAEAGTDYGVVTSFDSNGFSVGGTIDTGDTNYFNRTYVAWVWKGGGDAVTGTGTGVTNVSKSVNADAGFSIVEYTGGGSASNTVEHGFDNQTPELIIVKCISDAAFWCVWSSQLTSNYNLALNLTNAQFAANSGSNGGLGDATSSDITFVSGSVNLNTVNGSGRDYIAYCFHSVSGYSKIGSYTGNSSTQTIVTGFEPSFVMIKTINTVSNWVIFDNKRPNEYLMPSLSNAGSSSTDMVTGFVSNGFTLGADASTAAVNSSAANYIYMAFK